MKYTLHGFNQQKACELKLGLDELAVLRWFIDFRDTDRMEHREIDGRVYYWVVYSKVLDDLPILKCNSRTIANKFKKLEEAEILLHKTFKKGGTFSYYGVGDAYTLLLSDANIFHGSQKIDEGVGKKTTNGSQKIDEGVDKNLSYKDSSITYSSIKDSSINNIYSEPPSSPTKITKSIKQNRIFFENDPELNQEFQYFIDMRNSMKPKPTEHAIDLLIKELEKLSTDNGCFNRDIAIEIVKQSTRSSWKGLFPPKEQRNSSTPQKGKTAQELDSFYGMAKSWAERNRDEQ